MPCSDGGPSYSRSDELEENVKKLKTIINMQDTMLCSACRVLEKEGFDFDENPRLSEWWDEHKKEDQKREQATLKRRLRKEQAIEVAKKPFNTLSKEDKILLKAEGLL